jgi:hypothetical protein
LKSYPSIPRSTGQKFQEFYGHVFDKLDGSNLRFEWNKKRGWCKYGTRTRLFDQTDLVFGSAMPLFLRTLAEDLEKVFSKNRWQEVVVFTEFYGPKSFAGNHDLDDEKQLTIIDVSVHRNGIIPPTDFLKYFGHLNVPRYLGYTHWTRNYVERVRNEEIPGITFEGVVGKCHTRNRLVMAKAKTQRWIDQVLARYGQLEGQKIIDS